MTRRGLEVRVGIVVVLASVILILGVMWFQKFKLVERRYQFYARFSEVGGLKPGNVIYINGVERGRVEWVDLGADDVVVTMAIREGVEIPENSDISLRSVGIMGERFIAIKKGGATGAIAPGDTVDGEFMTGLSEVIGSAGEILDELMLTSRNLRDILETFSGEGRLQNSVENLSVASENLRAITEENQPRLARAIESIDNVSTRMDSLIERHYASLDSSLAGLGRTGQDIETAVKNLSMASEDLKEISRRLRDGEGTIGRLLSDDQFIDNLNSTVEKLDSLITDIKLRPGRYVRFELF